MRCKKKWLASKAPSRIEMSDNEIFILCGGNLIEVYSMDGQKKRSWILSSESMEYMSVGKKLVCVSDGNWIQFYDKRGLPLFQWLEKDCCDVLLVDDDLLYAAFKDKIKAFHLY